MVRGLVSLTELGMQWLGHLSGQQFAADPNHNRACNSYKHYTGVR